MASDEEHKHWRDVCNEFNTKLTYSKHATSFDNIQQGEVVYVTHYLGERWYPVQGIYEYTKSDGNLGITYISSFDRDDEMPRTISLQPNREVFLTEKECQNYINHYWYHHKCDNCKYNTYSAEHTCYNCKNKVQFEKQKITDDETYYCKKIYDKIGLKLKIAFHGINTNGNLICNQFDPIINNGDWIDFHWYMEVMKNCWCNTDNESSCIAKDTIDKSCSFKRELHRLHHLIFHRIYGNQEYIIHIYIPYYQWLKQTWIQDGKIFVNKISIVKSKKEKTHKIKYEDIEVNDYKNCNEIEQIVKDNNSK